MNSGANEVSWCPNKPKKERQLNREIMKKGNKNSEFCILKPCFPAFPILNVFYSS